MTKLLQNLFHLETVSLQQQRLCVQLIADTPESGIPAAGDFRVDVHYGNPNRCVSQQSAMTGLVPHQPFLKPVNHLLKQ
jgi:hypothetical protein